MKEQKTRRLAAIMFTDIVGYTALMQKDEHAATLVRERHRKSFQERHEKHHGEILQYFGDGTLSIFQSGVEAVECAIAIQQDLGQGQVVPLRIGLHMGDIVSDGTEIYGDGVNLAARIESMGTAGAILISGKLNGELYNQAQIKTETLGFFELKNINKPVEVFAVSNPGITIPQRDAIQGKHKQQLKSIAVLPFVNMSTSEENEYFSDGMTEEIINALAKIKNLKVTSRTSSFFFKNKNVPIRQIGKELNVSTILEGSIRLAGNKMRLTAQLIDVADDFHFWSETFDRSMDDIFAVQDEISLLVADKLREHLGHFDIDDHLVESPDIPVEAYKKYLKSRYHILKMGKRDVEIGISLLKEVVKDQPDFPLAYLGIHLGYTMLGTMGYMPAIEAFTTGQPYIEKAIELDENHPECQINLSYISLLQNWNLEETYQHLNKSFEIRPTVEYYQSMASALLADGKFEAALNYLETALQLDPFAEINYHLKGCIYYCLENFDSAIPLFEKSMQLKPSFTIPNLYKGQSLLLSAKKKEGLEFFQSLQGDESMDLMKLGGETMAYATLGEIEKAELGIAKLESALKTDMMGRALNLLILCFAMLGRKDATFNLIEQGLTYRLPMFVYLPTDPILKSFRTDPRFQSLMQQILGKSIDLKVAERKYKKSLFDAAVLAKYKKELDELMVNKKPYLDANLTLRSLAEMLSLPPNHLSQLLNEGFDKNFAEYINGHRVESFKQKVTDPKLQHLTILGLAFESGFNSKTVFNTFFKKTMGMTPKAYWREVVG